MKVTNYFIKYDARRDKTEIRPMGVVVILLAGILAIGAVFGVWHALTNHVTTIDAAALPTATPAGAGEIDGVWHPADTGSRPVNWSVSIAEDFGDDVVRYSLPSEVEAMVYADFNEIFDDWWEINLKTFNIEALENYVNLYYTGDELAKMQNALKNLKEAGQYGTAFDEQKPPYGLPHLAIEGVLPDGKTVYIRETTGARKMAYYNADGSIIEGSETISLPPAQDVYRLVFNDGLRRWQIAELVEGPIILSNPSQDGE